MNLTPQLTDKIQALYDGTPEYVHGVNLGYKRTGDQQTEKISIVFFVDKKLPLDQIPEAERLPASIVIDGVTVETDVQETLRANLVSCNASNSQDVTRLQPAVAGGPFLLPMRGGQEILQFPTKWAQNNSGGLSPQVAGTLGFFCVDNKDNKIVGVTNAHVVVNKRVLCSERDTDDYNTYDERAWDAGGKYPAGAVGANNGSALLVATRVKRYTGATFSGTNYVDAALLMMNPNLISADSYKVWGPIANGDAPGPFTSPMPFATTSEINNLLVSNPRCFSTGRTTGPKGFTDTASCRLRVNGLGATVSITDPDIVGTLSYADSIIYHYEDGSADPNAGGDSGSALIALINGVYKIIGVVFAGNGSVGIACRIDRFAEEMNVRAWDGTLNTNNIDPVTLRGDSALGELTVAKTDPRAGQTSFVHSDGFTYWQAGFRLSVSSSSSTALIISSSSSANVTSSSTSTDITCVGCANYYNTPPTYSTDDAGNPVISFAGVGDNWNGCPGYNLFLPQAKRPGGEWLYLVPRAAADNTTVNGIMTGGPLGALGTVEWNGINPYTGATITDRSSLLGYRWRFVEYVQAATTYEIRGTAYKLGGDVLATLCASGDAITSSSTTFSSSGVISSSNVAVLSSESSVTISNSSSSKTDTCDTCENNLVINGNFESGGDYWTCSSVDIATLPGDNNTWIDLNACSAGYISQTIATTPGQTYTLSFLLAGNCFCRSDWPCLWGGGNEYNLKVCRATAGSTSEEFSFSCDGLFPTDSATMGWVRRSLTFIASASSTLIKFESVAPETTCFGAAIDCVCVRPANSSSNNSLASSTSAANCARALTDTVACKILDTTGTMVGWRVDWRVSDNSYFDAYGRYLYHWQPCGPVCHPIFEYVNDAFVDVNGAITFNSPDPNPDGSFTKSIIYSATARNKPLDNPDYSQQTWLDGATVIDFAVQSQPGGQYNSWDVADACWDVQVPLTCAIGGASSSSSLSSSSSRTFNFSNCELPLCDNEPAACWVNFIHNSSSSGGTCVSADAQYASYKYPEECEFFHSDNPCAASYVDAVVELFDDKYFRVSFDGVVTDPAASLKFLGPSGYATVLLTDLQTIPAEAPQEIDPAYVPFDACEYLGADRQLYLREKGARAAIKTGNGSSSSSSSRSSSSAALIEPKVTVLYFTREWFNSAIVPQCFNDGVIQTETNDNITTETGEKLSLGSTAADFVDVLLTHMQPDGQLCKKPLTCALIPDAFIPVDNSSSSSSPPTTNEVCETIFDGNVGIYNVYFDRQIALRGYYGGLTRGENRRLNKTTPIVLVNWGAATLTENTNDPLSPGAGTFGRATTYKTNNTPNETFYGGWCDDVFDYNRTEIAAGMFSHRLYGGKISLNGLKLSATDLYADSSSSSNAAAGCYSYALLAGSLGACSITPRWRFNNGAFAVIDGSPTHGVVGNMFFNSADITAHCGGESNCYALLEMFGGATIVDNEKTPLIDRFVSYSSVMSCEAWDPINNQIVEPNLGTPSGITYAIDEMAGLSYPDAKCRFVQIQATDATTWPQYNSDGVDDENVGLDVSDDVQLAIIDINDTLTNRQELDTYGAQLLTYTESTRFNEGYCATRWIAGDWFLDLAPLREMIAPACVVKIAARRVKTCKYGKKYYGDWIYQTMPICPHFTCGTDCSNITTDPDRLDGGRVRGCTLESTAAVPPESYQTEDTCFAGCGKNFKCDSTLRPVYELQFTGGAHSRPYRVLVGYTVSGLCWKYAGQPDPSGDPASYEDNTGCQTHCNYCRDNDTPWHQRLGACSSSSRSSSSSSNSAVSSSNATISSSSATKYYCVRDKSSSSSSSSLSSSSSSSSGRTINQDFFCYECRNGDCQYVNVGTIPAINDPCWDNNTCCQSIGFYADQNCAGSCCPAGFVFNGAECVTEKYYCT